MKDDELETWRRQWQGQPAVPIDLIRKVERGTIYLRVGEYAFYLPLAITIATTIGAFLNPNLLSILFAAGLWLFIIIGRIFSNKNMKGVWAPTAETTAAYVDLSILRCRSRLSQIRFSNVLTPLITTFVLVGLYEMFASSGKLEKTEDYVIVGLSFLWTIGVVSLVQIILARQRKKIAVELAYLLDLKHRMENGQS
jgi:hypothetical protein